MKYLIFILTILCNCILNNENIEFTGELADSTSSYGTIVDISPYTKNNIIEVNANSTICKEYILGKQPNTYFYIIKNSKVTIYAPTMGIYIIKVKK